MPITNKITFVCDRDGMQSPEIEGPQSNMMVAQPPPDWVQLNWAITPSGESTKNALGYLCPTCAAAFREFMGLPPAAKSGSS